jgi:hypothetical protein
MKYRNYNVQLTQKIVKEHIKWVVELKANKDYIFYLSNDLNLIDNIETHKEYGILVKELKLIVDKRIIEKTIFNYK